MNKRLKQNLYISFISLLAVILFIKSFYYFQEFSWYDLLFWSLLAVIAETFQIISPSGVATSVAPAIYVYVSIVSNPLVVIAIIIIGCLFKFPEIDGEKKHIFNTRKSTTFFNLANLSLSLGVCAWIISLVDDGINSLIIIPVVIFALLIAEIINFILVSILFVITQNMNPMIVLKSMIKTFPSTIAIGMLGIFLAFSYDINSTNGKTFVLVFFIPLLLARYSFKLYFESQRMALDTIHALNEALHAKDAYTGGHTGRVEKYAVELAAAYGLTSSDCELIRTAALLHDIGKIGIPDGILNKPGRLTRDEFELIQEHSTIGAKILGNVNSLKRVSQIIIQHHERYDGTGYPNHIKGDDIAIEAAILMISDSYDAMTTDRPYRKALSKTEAILELSKFSGTQFHPMLAKCFVEGVLNKEVEEFREDVMPESEVMTLLRKTTDIIEDTANIPHDAMQSEVEAEERRVKDKINHYTPHNPQKMHRIKESR